MTNLLNKRNLAAKTLGVGKNRIWFNSENFSDIKEAITKQDIKELYAEGIIAVKPIKGRRKIVRRKIRRGPGKIKRTIKKRKQTYVKITRKLRKYLAELKRLGRINHDLYRELRNKIRMRVFRSKAHLKEYLENKEKLEIKSMAIKNDRKEKTKSEVKEKKTKKTIKETK